jgi:hypothetical protein
MFSSFYWELTFFPEYTNLECKKHIYFCKKETHLLFFVVSFFGLSNFHADVSAKLFTFTRSLLLRNTDYRIRKKKKNTYYRAKLQSKGATKNCQWIKAGRMHLFDAEARAAPFKKKLRTVRLSNLSSSPIGHMLRFFLLPRLNFWMQWLALPNCN